MASPFFKMQYLILPIFGFNFVNCDEFHLKITPSRQNKCSSSKLSNAFRFGESDRIGLKMVLLNRCVASSALFKQSKWLEDTALDLRRHSVWLFLLCTWPHFSVLGTNGHSCQLVQYSCSSLELLQKVRPRHTSYPFLDSEHSIVPIWLIHGKEDFIGEIVRHFLAGSQYVSSDCMVPFGQNTLSRPKMERSTFREQTCVNTYMHVCYLIFLGSRHLDGQHNIPHLSVWCSHCHNDKY